MKSLAGRRLQQVLALRLMNLSEAGDYNLASRSLGHWTAEYFGKEIRCKIQLILVCGLMWLN